jgi:hypothetical protein
MAVYHGVLQQVSGGSSDSEETRREFINIGNTHVSGVVLSNYQDEMLNNVLGQEVVLSGFHRGDDNFVVMGIKLPDGKVL